MDAYSTVDPNTRRHLESLLQTWKKPPTGSSDMRPTFPSDITGSIDTALIKGRTLAIQRNSQTSRPQVLQRMGTPNGASLRDPRLRPQPGPPSFPTPPPGQPVAPTPYQSYNMPQAGPPSYPMQNPSNGHMPPNGISTSERLISDVKQLIVSVYNELQSKPNEPGMTRLLQMLATLQTQLQQGQCSPQEIRGIEEQVARISAIFQQSAPPHPAPTHAYHMAPAQAPFLSPGTPNLSSPAVSSPLTNQAPAPVPVFPNFPNASATAPSFQPASVPPSGRFSSDSKCRSKLQRCQHPTSALQVP